MKWLGNGWFSCSGTVLEIQGISWTHCWGEKSFDLELSMRIEIKCENFERHCCSIAFKVNVTTSFSTLAIALARLSFHVLMSIEKDYILGKVFHFQIYIHSEDSKKWILPHLVIWLFNYSAWNRKQPQLARIQSIPVFWLGFHKI